MCTQSESLNLCNSKILIFPFLGFGGVVLIIKVLFTASQRATLCIDPDRWVHRAGLLLHLFFLALEQRFFSTTRLCKKWLHIHMYTNIPTSQHKPFVWLSLLPNSSSFLSRVLAVIADCRMLWCLHTHAVLKMALSRTKMLLLAHLFESC